MVSLRSLALTRPVCSSMTGKHLSMLLVVLLSCLQHVCVGADEQVTADELRKLGSLLNYFPLNEGEGETIYDYGDMQTQGSFVGALKPSWKRQGSQCRVVLEFPGSEAAVELNQPYLDKFDGAHTIFVWIYFYQGAPHRDIFFGNFAGGGELNMEKHHVNDMRYFRNWAPSWVGAPNTVLINEWNLLAFSRKDSSNQPTLTMANIVTGHSEVLHMTTPIRSVPLTTPHYLGSDTRRGLTTLNGLLGPVITFQTELEKIDTDRLLHLTSPICPLTEITVSEETLTVAEGSEISNEGTHIPNDGTLSTNVGVITDKGSGEWTWSHTPVKGPRDSISVEIFVTDSQGNTASETFSLKVENVAPTITELNVDVKDPRGDVTLDAIVEDPGVEDVLSASVEWGDTSTTNTDVEQNNADSPIREISSAHHYERGGNYRVVLTVHDDELASDSKEEFVVVPHSPKIAPFPETDGQAPVRPIGRGVIPFGIFSDSSFDATLTDVESIRVGTPSEIENGGGCVPKGRSQEKDFNGDGLLDLKFLCEGDTGISLDEDFTVLELAGQDVNGIPLFGSVDVRVTGTGDSTGNGNGRGRPSLRS